MPTSSTPLSNAVNQPAVHLTFYAAGRHRIVSFDSANSDFRETIQTLHEQNCPFRIIYT